MGSTNVKDRGFQPFREVQENKSRDGLTLGSQFDLASLRAPHSYDGPYGSVVGRPSVPPKQPQQQPDLRLPIQGNPSTGPRNGGLQYDGPRQQASRPNYMEDLDYSRPAYPPVRGYPEPRHPPPRAYDPSDEPMNSPLFNRQTNDPRYTAGESFHDQRMSPERRYEGNGFRRMEEDNDTDHGRISPPRKDKPIPPLPSSRSSNERTLEAGVDETELWRQIRSQVQRKNPSISSSHSSDSGTTRSHPSENTPPSSAASPITPSKQTEYPISINSVKTKVEHKSEHLGPSAKASLPICRACQGPIKGRSLASQDGKLSGRYHKRCFCCTTCQKPFETATFYVFQDRPYCKRHYHELNHSTCGECGEGVEGRCLQLEDNTIRHPACFTCHVFHSLYVT